ncbi:mechanosensitive ion channel domain-containing protein [Thermomonas sp.]|uniref:mechanosensitive ion channel family protein n=1 Tax=Thermomonas sp. TaxID=1971895 RepID=UPI002489C91E|nr:mechanosensitive ion channel domain-containing protein [Thermomonas sp.]MDI1252648.1 mechanosensitive ion channel [Thermomonas sp.]
MGLNPDIGQKLEKAGDAVRDAANDSARAGWNGLQPLLDFQLLYLGGISITVGGLVGAVVAFVLAWLVSLLLRRALKRYGERNQSANQAALYTLSTLLHYFLLAIGLFMALDSIGVSLGKFAVFAGAIGVGLGFGLQAIFSNFISGLILLFDRSLKVGDFVELDASTRGTVRAINIRATRITTNDNIDLLVPNSEFVTGRVVNWTHGSENRRIRVSFSVAYGADKELVKKAALEAASRVSFTLATEGDKRPQVWLTNFADSKVEYMLVVWLTVEAARRNAAINAAYLWEIDTAMRAHGIEMPFPQSDLNLRSLFGLTGDEALAALQGKSVQAKTSADVFTAPERLPAHEREQLASNDAGKDVEAGVTQAAAEDANQPRDEDHRDPASP